MVLYQKTFGRALSTPGLESWYRPLTQWCKRGILPDSESGELSAAQRYTTTYHNIVISCIQFIVLSS